MSKKRRSKPHWFKIDTQMRGTFDVIDHKKIGEAFILALNYFDCLAEASVYDTPEEKEDSLRRARAVVDSINDDVLRIAFGTFKGLVDGSIAEYERSVQAARDFWDKHQAADS